MIRLVFCNYKNKRSIEEVIDTSHSLSFCVIHHLDNQVCEVIVHEGVEMDDLMVDEYHAYLEAYYDGPFMLLVNKENNYTYTFSAQQRVADLVNIKAIAVLAYRRSTEIATQALKNFKREHEWNLQIFHDRNLALEWLESQLALEKI